MIDLHDTVARLMLPNMAHGKISSLKAGALLKQAAVVRRGTGTCWRRLLDIVWAATMQELF
jgi:hypothetical protein